MNIHTSRANLPMGPRRQDCKKLLRMQSPTYPSVNNQRKNGAGGIKSTANTLGP